MSFIEKNLECLKKNRVQIYDKVLEIINDNEYDSSKFEIIDTKVGDKTIGINNNGKIVRLNSIYNPQKEAERWADKYNFDSIDTPILMFGIANGVFVREMLLRAGDNCVAILVEPDVSLFIFCLYQFDMTDIIGDIRVELLVDKINFEKLIDIINSVIGFESIYTQIVCAHPKLDKIYHDKSVEFANAVRKNILQSDSDYNTIMLLEEHSIDNIFKNLHFIKQSNHVSDLVGIIPKDIPFIIVAAGPSLDNNVDILKKAEGKSFILATDRAVKTLIAHNIKYDAIITIDSRKSVEFLDDPRCFEYPILACIDSKNDILELNKGRKIWLTYSKFFIELYRKYHINMNIYSIGGSVATAAFNVARTIGSEKIILVGQDLAYKGESSHTGGFVEKNILNDCDDEYVTDIYGKQVKTRRDWIYYLDWFETSIKKLNDNVKVIDATEGGAKIEGTEIMNLSDAIQLYCNKEFNFKENLKKILPTFNHEKYLEVKQDLFHLKEEFSLIEQNAKRGLDASEKMLKTIKNKMKTDIEEEEFIYSKIIKNVNEIIEKQLAYTIIERNVIKDTTLVMRGINFVTNNKIDDLKKTCEISKFVYERILESIKIITPKLYASLEEI